MELNICHLYPDLLNVYGDVGNILILKHRAENRGIKVNVINVSINDEFNADDYDIVFFGGGQDYEQSIVSNDLMTNKKDELSRYINNGKVLIAICGGYQLLGKYYTAPNGEKIQGLGILDIYTEAGNTRFIGDTIIYNEDFNETYVGFENHSGRTYLNGLKPLGNWHSHPSSPSRPSQEDIKLAFDSNASYMIISFMAENPVLNSFHIENGQVEKEDLRIYSDEYYF